MMVRDYMSVSVAQEPNDVVGSSPSGASKLNDGRLNDGEYGHDVPAESSKHRHVKLKS